MEDFQSKYSGEQVEEMLDQIANGEAGGGGGGITAETDPIFSASAAADITAEDITEWNGKQDMLVSGTNIKTINGESIVGSGDITISGGGVSEDYVNTAIANAITTTLNTAV